MQIITLLTDWNKPNYYVGQITGRLISIGHDIQVLPLSPAVKKHDISQAAYLLRHCYKHFPNGTIHLVFVGLSMNDGRFLIIEKENHLFIAPDNGILSLVFQGHIPNAYVLEPSPLESELFPGKETMLLGIENYLSTHQTGKCGTLTPNIRELIIPQPVTTPNSIQGKIDYIDPYGNAVTNISRDFFLQVVGNKDFHIYVQSKSHEINKISDQYPIDEPGELIAVFNTLGFLEIAINQGNVSKLLNLTTDSVILIKF